MSKPLLAALPVLLLSACVSSAPATTATPPAPMASGQCDARLATPWLRKPATAETAEAIRIATGSKLLRMLKPNDAMTMDYREDRVNVLQDTDGNIEKISCG